MINYDKLQKNNDYNIGNNNNNNNNNYNNNNSNNNNNNNNIIVSHRKFTCSKRAIETLEHGMKLVQS